MYVLDRRADINLESFRRVAWEGEPIALSDAARERIAAARRAFLGYIEAHPDRRVYGANTRVGPGVKTVLRGGDLRTQSARRPGAAGVSFGEKLPPRAVRGILLARLANFVEGNSGVSLAVVEAVSDMLDGRALPAVPGRGNGAAGEINALGHLFFELADRVEMGPKDNSALTNGSPCASALVADAALMARRRIDLATQVFALAIEGFRAPLEHYDPVLADCWGNPHDRTALYALAPYLEGAAGERRAWQAPVSFRVIPRLLGQAFHALLQAQECARWSLASITDNPTYLPPGSEHAPATEFPHGRVLHAGGFHNAAAYNAMDSLSGAWADLVLLTDRLCAKTLDGNVSGLPHGLDGGAVYDAPRYLPGALVAIGEQAAAPRNGPSCRGAASMRRRGSPISGRRCSPRGTRTRKRGTACSPRWRCSRQLRCGRSMSAGGCPHLRSTASMSTSGSSSRPSTRPDCWGRTWKRSTGSSDGRYATRQAASCRGTVQASTRQSAGADGMLQRPDSPHNRRGRFPAESGLIGEFRAIRAERE